MFLCNHFFSLLFKAFAKTQDLLIQVLYYMASQLLVLKGCSYLVQSLTPSCFKLKRLPLVKNEEQPSAHSGKAPLHRRSWEDMHSVLSSNMDPFCDLRDHFTSHCLVFLLIKMAVLHQVPHSQEYCAEQLRVN